MADLSKFLAIGEVAARTGVTEATLRAWERRHGFPRPQRLEGGHRRYAAQEVALIERVSEERRRGLSVAAAIARVTAAPVEPIRSLFATLRAWRPDVAAHRLRKRELLRLSRAIEDETSARAERAILVGGFQSARFYRHSERRWMDLARTADAAIVYADFRRFRAPRGAPAEVPVSRRDPLSREWIVVLDAPTSAACLAGRELPGQAHGSDRLFEALWTVEPEVVRDAARIAAELARGGAERLASGILARLEAMPLAPLEGQLRLSTAITARALSAEPSIAR